MRMMFDLKERGPEQLRRSVLRLPPNYTLSLTESNLSISARGGGGRRIFMITRQGRPLHVNVSELQSATEATKALVREHERILEEEGIS